MFPPPELVLWVGSRVCGEFGERKEGARKSRQATSETVQSLCTPRRRQQRPTCPPVQTAVSIWAVSSFRGY